MLAALSTTTVTPAMSSTGGAARRKKTRTADAMTSVSVSTSTMNDHPTTTDATDALHPDLLLHDRAKVNRSASTASGPSRPSSAEPSGRAASTQKASRPTTEIGIQRHGF